MPALHDPASILNETSLLDTFLELARINTQSDPKSDATPSTASQFDGLKVVARRLKELGLADADIDAHGYLYATLPGTVAQAPVVGLIAHIDTAPDFSGAGVQPILHEKYEGGSITLAGGVVIDPADNPELLQCLGDTIITADGTTLLGADDKAGVAAIIAAVERLLAHPEIRRPTLRIAITPDEEIGRGAEHFDIPRFGADVAFTLDGGFAGEINGETFSADAATVRFTGVMVHPGSAKGRMVNALRWAARYVDALPAAESPEQTSGRDGFFHPTEIVGGAYQASVSMILRDFDLDKLARRGVFLKELAARFMAEEPRLKVEVDISETYRNMAYWLKDRPEIMQRLEQAVRLAGVTPRIEPIRGGTDGSGLTARGLPTPNIFAGGMNFHGPREWVSLRGMALAVCAVVNLAQLFAGESL